MQKIYHLLVVCLWCSIQAAAQDTNGTNASLTLMGLDPAAVNPITHQVNVPAPGLLQIAVRSGNNAAQGLILATGPFAPALIPTPWGGSFDLGTPNPFPPFLPNNVQILGDGISFSGGNLLNQYFITDTSASPEFRLGLGVPGFFSGFTGPAIQAVVADPANPPFNLDNTAAGNPNYINGQILTVNTGDDNSVLVQLLPGKTFNYYGLSFTELYINGNGVISFTSPLVFPGVFYAGNTIGQLNDVPHIAVNWSDWNITEQGVLSDGILYVETGSTVDIGWGASQGTFGTSQSGISHFGDLDIAEFHCTLELADVTMSPTEGQIQMVFTNLDPSAANNNDAVIGLVRGSGLGSMNFNQDFHTGVVGGPDDSLLEEHDSTASLLPANRIGYDGAGARQCYHNGNKFNGQTATFTPNPSVMVTGDQGYTVTMNLPRPNDAVSLTPVTGSNSGGDILTLCGWFRFFETIANPGVASVVFDPGGANLPGLILGVLDNSSTNDIAVPNPSNPEYRDHEGLVVMSPANTGFTGSVDVQVNFDNGDVIVLPAAFLYTPPGSITTIYSTLLDDGVQIHPLSVQPTISLGGTTYTQIRISSNGYITFNVSSSDFTQTTGEFFNGFRTAGTAPLAANPGVAVTWQDLNPPNVAGDNVTVIEDSVAQSVTVQYNNQTAWNSNLAIGSVSVTFGSPSIDSVSFDFSGYITNPGIAADDRPIVGITAGSDSAGFPFNETVVDISAQIGMGVLPTGSFCDAFGGFDAVPPATHGPVDLQSVNMGSGVFSAVELGTYDYLLL